MHPDLITLHAAVSALLRANLAVARATRAYHRASRRPYPIDFWFRASALSYADPEGDTLRRAEARQREAADRVSSSWEPLNTDYPSLALPPSFPSPDPSPNGNHA